MYEGGHDLEGSGTTAEKTAAVRVFFNFVLLSGLTKQMQTTGSNIPTTMLGNATEPVSVSVSGGTSPYTYSWSSTAGGSFANTATNSTTYTAPASGSGIIKCIVTDACGRKKIIASVFSTSGTLPITLVGFTAKPAGEQVKLAWKTANEINNDYFTLERSADGKNFAELTQLKGAGNSTSMKYYEYADESPLNGTTYYRLRQTDFDGKFTYSSIITAVLKNAKQATTAIQAVYPNPFSEHLSITYSSSEDGPAQLSILNTKGEILFDTKQNAVKGSNLFDLPSVSFLPPGTYFARLLVNGEVSIQKIIKN